jgi:hypothetical protein
MSVEETSFQLHVPDNRKLFRILMILCLHWIKKSAIVKNQL